jgi:hypothetical protein
MKKNKAQKLSANAPAAHSPVQQNEILKKESTFSENSPSISNDIPQPFELIRFDKKLNIFLGLCVGIFLILSLLKIHGSSVAAWNDRIPEGSTSTKNIIAGTPKVIRMDEYAVLTPFTLSQVKKGFPIKNESIGGENAPLMSFLPTKHFITFFRPNFWGYFFLSTEQAFAWAWNFKALGIMIAMTLMLMLLTGNNFWLSIFGAFWMLFSSGTQWWYSTTLPDSIFSAAILFTCTVYLIFSKNTLSLIISTFCFILFGVYYAGMLYPPYQLPLAYFIIFLLIGYVIQNYNKELIFNKLYLKIGFASLAVVGLTIVMFKFYSDVKPTIEALMNTAYPGKRVDLGGSGFTANMFSEYYHLFINNETFPQIWINICEMSHYLNFTPVIIGCTIWYYVATKKVNYLLLFPSIFVVFLLIWIKIGFPESLAKLTLMSMSPPKRTQIPFGIANVILALVYIGQLKNLKLGNVPVSKTIVVMVIVVFFVAITAATNDSSSNHFFKTPQLVIGVLLFSLANIFLLPSINFKFREFAFMGIIGISLIPNIMVNPIARGLSPITEHRIYQNIKEIDQKDSQKRWLVMGNQFLGYMAQTAGVDVLGGVKYVPDLKTMRVIDGKYHRDSVYNRYAHTVYSSYIDGKDSTIVALNFEDGYSIGLDGCSLRLKQLNVKYVLFEKQPQPVEVRCMTKIVDEGFQIYRINE